MIRISVLVACLCCGACLCGSAVADTTDSMLFLNDGPHLFWQDDTTAIVMYYCDSAMSSRTIHGTDTLRFTGFCEDTLVEYVVPVAPREAGPYLFGSVSRVMCISDLHGDLEHFADILVNAGVLDGAYHWSWGDGHLVVNGDVFDRGDRVTECLWLIYRLELEAAAAGGAVHLLLGNHELMVMRGDLRYVHPRYMKGIAHRRRIEYEDLFGPDMELGRWLRTKHTVIRINDLLFVHGGLAPVMMNERWDAARINETARNGFDVSAARLLNDSTLSLFYGSFGPFWYRGILEPLEDRYAAASTAQVDSLLAYYGARQMVVGHSQQDSIVIYHGGKVVAVDVLVEDLGCQQAALWQDGVLYRVLGSGELHRIHDPSRGR